MRAKNQLSQEDQELINRIKLNDITAQGDFVKRFDPLISIVVNNSSIKKIDIEEKKDLVQSIKIKCIENIKKHEIRESLSGWISALAKNHCRDEYRKIPSKEKVAQYEYENAPRSKNISKTKNLNIESVFKKSILKSIEPELDKSIELFKELYELKNKLETNYKLNKYSSVYRLSILFHKTKKKVECILGHNTPSREIIRRYQEIKEPHCYNGTDEEDKRLAAEAIERKKLEKNFGDRLFIYEKLYELIDYFDSIIGNIKNGPPSYIPDIWGTFEDFIDDILNLHISPQVLMFRVWDKYKETKTGKKRNLPRLKLIFAYYKKKTKGTESEFLFNSIPNKNITSEEFKRKFETIRQLFYRSQKSPNNKLYKKLEGFIYKKSKK